MNPITLGDIHYSWFDTYAYYHERYLEAIANPGMPYGPLYRYMRILTDLIKQGYLNDFRVGTSMFTLILTRSIKHHYRSDQKWIRIHVTDTGILLGHNLDGEIVKKEIEYIGVESILVYLERLKAYPFD